jgi:hypothetical protein
MVRFQCPTYSTATRKETARHPAGNDEDSLLYKEASSWVFVQVPHNRELSKCSTGLSALLHLLKLFEDIPQTSNTTPGICQKGASPMLFKSSRSMTILSSYCIAVLCLALTACGGGYYTSKVNGGKQVYRVDEQGNATLVNEVDPNGQTTIHDAEDSMAKRQMASQEMSEQMRARKVERLEALSTAPKRQPQNLIYVSLAPPVLDSRMQQAEKPKGAVAKQIRNEFASDPNH